MNRKVRDADFMEDCWANPYTTVKHLMSVTGELSSSGSSGGTQEEQ